MYENILESVRLDKAEDDWSPQTTKHSSDIIKNNEILRHIDHSYFLICNSCLWCATYFGIGNSFTTAKLYSRTINHEFNRAEIDHSVITSTFFIIMPHPLLSICQYAT
jgi:hypothetical protein